MSDYNEMFISKLQEEPFVTKWVAQNSHEKHIHNERLVKPGHD